MLALLFATTALHAEERRASRGERLALEGRCGVAIPELTQELASTPEPGRISWRLGQCLLRERRYPEAVTALDRATSTDPALVEAQLDLARARYHVHDLAGADAALRASEAEFSEEAIWNLYRGMVDLEGGDPEAAVVALQRAVDINRAGFRTRDDLQAVEPVASYYLGIALREAGQEERAAATLREVAEDWKGTAWADEAGRATAPASRTLGGAWLTLSAGAEYDDNVVLSGRDTPLPSDISDEAGARSIWAARGAADLGRWGKNAAGVRASYRGRAHWDSDLRAFDTHFPTASLWFNHAWLPDTHVRARYDFAYAWVETDPYVVSNGARLSVIHAWSPRQNSSLAASAYVDEYLYTPMDVPDGPGTPGAGCTDPTFPVCGPAGVDESRVRERDGVGTTASFSHGWSPTLDGFATSQPSFYGNYTYTHFDAEGREYTQQSHRVTVGAGFTLMYGASLDLSGSYTWRVYRHPSTFPQQEDLVPGEEYFLSNTRRREHIVVAATQLTVPLTERISGSATYQYRDSRSTADVFDYDQHIVGLLFNVTLARP